MKIRRIAAFLLLLLALALATTAAEDKFGVAVYSGAVYDADTSAFLVKLMAFQAAACYRTNDTVSQVSEFYKGQPGVQVISIKASGSIFTKDGGIQITVQNPWKDLKTNRQMRDTLISIVKMK